LHHQTKNIANDYTQTLNKIHIDFAQHLALLAQRAQQAGTTLGGVQGLQQHGQSFHASLQQLATSLQSSLESGSYMVHLRLFTGFTLIPYQDDPLFPSEIDNTTAGNCIHGVGLGVLLSKNIDKHSDITYFKT
jgi:hypothetical protein